MREGFEIYIGPDPDTGEVDIEKITEILKVRHDKFVIKGIFEGYWRGYAEDTLIISIMDIEDIISETISILEQELNQAAIAIMSSEDLRLI